MSIRRRSRGGVLDGKCILVLIKDVQRLYHAAHGRRRVAQWPRGDVCGRAGRVMVGEH